MAAAPRDVRHLIDALSPLARVVRYSDVRGATADDVEPIQAAIFERALIGLPARVLARRRRGRRWSKA